MLSSALPTIWHFRNFDPRLLRPLAASNASSVQSFHCRIKQLQYNAFPCILKPPCKNGAKFQLPQLCRGILQVQSFFIQCHFLYFESPMLKWSEILIGSTVLGDTTSWENFYFYLRAQTWQRAKYNSTTGHPMPWKSHLHKSSCLVWYWYELI